MNPDPVNQLLQLGRDLKAAGDDGKGLKKELLKAGRDLKVPFKKAVMAAALDTLPKKGGLNEWVAGRIRVTASTRLTGKNVGIRFKTKHPGKTGLSDLPAIDNGRVRHPLYGNTDHWYLSKVTPGFMGKALNEVGDDMRDEFLKAVDTIAARLAAGG